MALAAQEEWIPPARKDQILFFPIERKRRKLAGERTGGMKRMLVKKGMLYSYKVIKLQIPDILSFCMKDRYTLHHVMRKNKMW